MNRFIPRSVIAVATFLSLFTNSSGEEATPPVAVTTKVFRLGFPIVGRSQQPKTVNLAEDVTLGSAFLLQLRRQAVLLAAREEFHALTRDTALGETTPEGAVDVNDIATVPSAAPPYKDHRSFVAELESRSRNEIVIELEKLGLERAPPPTATDDDEATAAIDKLLHDTTIVAQFEAVRRLHRLIREKGETRPRLERLVRGYTQLEMLTNTAYIDTHRVFQARAVLYAQRAVVKFGETPQTLALRASTWSLNDFHRIAREEFAALRSQGPIPEDAWSRLAMAYCDYDFDKLKDLGETLEPAEERPFAKLLAFFLAECGCPEDYAPRPYGESILADLPDCGRLHLRTFHLNTFDMIRSPDGSAFYEHLARTVGPAVRKMSRLPQPVRDAAGALDKSIRKSTTPLLDSFLGRETQRRGFPLEQYYIDLAGLLKTLYDAPAAGDRDEPSLQVLGTLLSDEATETVHEVGKGLRGHNGAPEGIILPAKPLLDLHPAVDFVGLYCRDTENRDPFWKHLNHSELPYNFFSQCCVGYWNPVLHDDIQAKNPNPYRIYSPPFFANLFADRENVRDMTQYHHAAIKDPRLPRGKHYFAVDLLRDLCPNNTWAVGVSLARGWKYDAIEAERLLEKYSKSTYVRLILAELFQMNGREELSCKINEEEFHKNPSKMLKDYLVRYYLERFDNAKAIEIVRSFVESPQSDRSLTRYRSTLEIGQILFQEGKIAEAEQYFIPMFQTHACDGLSFMGDYRQATGKFDEAVNAYRMQMSSYPEQGPFHWWCGCYCMDHPDLPKATDTILKRFSRFKSAAPNDVKQRNENKTQNYQVLYICMSMDLPFPEELGEDPLYNELLLSGDCVCGFEKYFEALRKGDKTEAERLIRLLREQWALLGNNDPFFEAQRKVNPKLENGVYTPYYARQLAALFEQDQKNAKPGALDPAEVDYLLALQYRSDLNCTYVPWMLYILGRYYDLCGEKEKSLDSYRRLLALRYDNFWQARCLAVKELRKNGLDKEEYVKRTQGDAKIPRRRSSNETADVLCALLFRDYSDSPSRTLRARPVSKKAAAAETVPDFGKTTETVPGIYKTSRIVFRGETIPENDTVLYWTVPKDETNADRPSWSVNGIASQTGFWIERSDRRTDGLYPMRFQYDGEWLPALASFHGDHLVLAVSLDPARQPESLSPPPASDCVRIELKKVADLPVGNTSLVQASVTLPSPIAGDDAETTWMSYMRFCAAGTAVLAITLALAISLIRRRSAN